MRLSILFCLKFYFFVLMFFGAGRMWAQVELEWVNPVYGNYSGNEDLSCSVLTDDFGNVYTVGIFYGTIDFAPGTDTFFLTSTYNARIFVQKLNPNGSLIWAKKFDGYDVNYRGVVATIDASSNVYITSVISSGGGAYIRKIDSNGNLVWVQNLLGSNGAYTGINCYSIKVDLSGNVYTCGTFDWTVDFDNGSGTLNLTSTGTWDMFIHKLDSSGNFVWAKQIGGTGADAVMSMDIDQFGNLYYTGYFQETTDFDLGIGTSNLTATWNTNESDIFILKLDSNANFIWVKQIGGYLSDLAHYILVDEFNNIYVRGYTSGADVDPGPNVFTLSPSGSRFILKLDLNGNFIWAKPDFDGNVAGRGGNIATDNQGNVYLIGDFTGTVDFDSGISTFYLTGLGDPVFNSDIFILKLDNSGNFVWAKQFGMTKGYSFKGFIGVDKYENIYASGEFWGALNDFDPDEGVLNLVSAANSDVFTLKLSQKNIHGNVFQDFNLNCSIDANETRIKNKIFTIQPGNLVTQSNSSGIWSLDSLPAGTYTITADTSSPNWQITCPVTQTFTVIHPDSFTIAPAFGFVSTNPCPSLDISIHIPSLRPGFSNQNVYIQTCNGYDGTGILDSGYVIVELDSLLTVQSGSQSYTALGNNLYRVNIGSLYPGQCADFYLTCQLSATATIGQTLCIQANLYPVDSCALDDIPNPYPSGTVSPCTLPWDGSSLSVETACTGDSVRFVVYNGGLNMNCHAPIKVYLDGQYIQLDSIQLQGGDSIVYIFAGNAQTWRLEAYQHPLHPGNSHPNATIENCGTGNWTPNLVNILPMDDADPVVDIYCGVVTGSYDPNDKTGYPLGIGNTHDILPNQEMEYLIRFQNTGTDTAFTVVIRDTLSMDFDIFSVQSGVSSHDYDFRMYGPRVLEWTFYNIMLPDSNVNEAASHGFVKFKVQQKADLTNGTRIENSAAIYFDFNAPVITNTSWHTIKNPLFNTINIEKIASENLSFKVYPNPNNGLFYLDISASSIQRQNNADIQILVLDNLGRTLLSKQSNDVITELNINHLATGVYYISVNDGKVIRTEKVVKW